MNKEVKEQVKVNSVALGAALTAGNIVATALQPLGRKQRKALFAITVASANLNNDANISFGVVDDTVVTPVATADLAALAATDDTLCYQLTGVGGLMDGCHAMSVDVVGSGDGIITINGTEFPYAAVPATAFEWDDAAALIVAINASGLGLTAASGGGEVVTLASTLPGEENIVYADTVTNIIATDIVIIAYSVLMEVDASEMAAGATGVYGVVDCIAGTGAATVHGHIIKGDGRYTPEQTAALSL